MTERSDATINNSSLTKEQRARLAAILASQGDFGRAFLIFYGLGDDYAAEFLANNPENSGGDD